MAVRAPAAVAEAADRLGLGPLRRSYHGSVPLHRYFGIFLTGFGLFLLSQGAPWLIVTALLVPGGAFLTYTVLTRINTAVHRYERGFVQVGIDRKIKVAARWSDIARTTDSTTVVRGAGPPIHHARYIVMLHDGRSAEFGLQYLRGAQDLYDDIVDQHRRAAGRR